ncbi:MAG: hypothetical protein R3322_03765 [Kiloniellales bacterium]|jgi:hypothetical protein|nr:hypothetical protein [Kiloniellales bacterium]
MPKHPLAILLALLSTALAGCADPQKQANLELACQLTKCICVSEAGSSYIDRNFRSQRTTTTDVQWTERGRASCPEGYFLQRFDDDNKVRYYTPRSQRTD